MAYRKKAELILAHQPDIVIIPECEHPDKLIFKNDLPKPASILWYGTNKNKGLGILSYGNYKMKIMDVHDPSIKTILPIEITIRRKRIILLAVWAFNQDDKGYVYIGQLWKAIEKYKVLLKNKNVIIAGDFNSNVQWDKLKRKVNHSTVVDQLGKLKIYSCYHSFNKLKQGSEPHPTFYLYRHLDKPYHLDYCFLSQSLLKKVENVEVGRYEDWRSCSDHVPVFVTVRESER